jgi:hypothetical protein
MPNQPGSPSGAGAGSPAQTVEFTFVVDTSKGTVTIKNFQQLLAQLAGQTIPAVSQAGQNTAQSNVAQGVSWLVLYEKVKAVEEVFGKYIDRASDLIKESTMLAARIEVLNHVMALTAQAMNYSAGAAEAQVQALQKLGITHKEAIDTTMQFLRMQLKLTDAEKLASAARDLAVVSGQNTSEALGTLTEAIETNREVLLRQFGIVKTLPMIFDQYADSINRSAASLTTQERQQAILNTILLESHKVTGSYSLAMEDAGKRVTSLARHIEEVKEQIGKGFVPVMLTMIKGIETFLEVAQKIPAWAYVVVGTLTTVVGIIISLTAAIKGLSLAMVALGAAEEASFGAQVVSMITAFANPWVGIPALILAVVATLGALGIYWEGAFRRQIQTTTEMAAQVEEVKNLESSLKDLAATQAHIQTLKTTGITAIEREQFHYITDQEKQRYLTDQAINTAKAQENALLDEARSKNIDISAALDKQKEHIVDMAKASALLKAEEDKRKAALADQLKLLKDQKADLEYQLKQHQGVMADQLKLPSALKAIASAPGVSTLFTGMEDQTEKVGALRNALKEVDNEIKAIKEHSGAQLIPVDLTTTVTALQKVQHVLELNRELRMAGAKQLTIDTAMQQRAADSIQAYYTRLDENYKNIIENGKERGLTEGAIARAKKDQADYQTEAKDSQATLNEAIHKGTGFQTAMTSEVNRMTVSMSKAAENGKLYGNVLEGIDESSTSMAEMRLESQRKSNEQSAVGLELAKTRLQVQINESEQLPKTAAAYDRILAIRNEIADLDVRMARLRSPETAEAARVTAESTKRINAIQDQRHAEEDRIAVVKSAIAIEQAHANEYGLSVEQRLAFLKRTTDAEIAALKNTANSQSVINAQIAQKNAEAWLQQQSIIRQGVLDTLNMQKTLYDQMSAVIESRVSKGIGSDEDVAALKHFADLQAETALKVYMTEKFYQDLAVHGWQQAIANLAVFEVSTAQQTADKKLQIELNAMRARYQLQEQYRDLADRVAVAHGERLKESVDIDKQIRDLNQQIDELVRQTSEPEKIKALNQQREALIHSLELEKQLRQAIAGLEAAKGLKGAGGVSVVFDPKQAMQARQQGMDALKDQAQHYKERYDAAKQVQEQQEAGGGKASQEAIEATTKSWQDYQGALQQVQDQLPDLNTAMSQFFQGMHDKAQVVPLIQAAMTQLGDAMATVFEQIGAGTGNVGKAFAKMGADFLKSLGHMAMQQAMFFFAEAIISATVGPWAAYGVSAGQWAIAGAIAMAAGIALSVAGGAAGAATGGGGGGGGGTGGATAPTASPQPGVPGARAQGLQQVQPAATKTNIDDMVITMQQALIVNGRQIAGVGSAMTDMAGQFFQFTKVEQALAASNHETERVFADQQTKIYDQMLNAGASQQQFNDFFSQFSAQATDLMRENHESTDGLGDILNANLTQSTSAQDDSTAQITSILNKVHAVLQDIYGKDATITVNPSLTVDGTDVAAALQTSGGALSSFVTSGQIRDNVNRRDLGLALGTAGL